MDNLKFVFKRAGNMELVSNFIESVYDRFGKSEVFLFGPHGIEYIFESPTKAILFAFEEIARNDEKVISGDIVDTNHGLKCIITSTNGEFSFKKLSSYKYKVENSTDFKLSLAKKEFASRFSSFELESICGKKPYNYVETPHIDGFSAFENKIIGFLNRYYGEDGWVNYELEANKLDNIPVGYELRVTFLTGQTVELNKLV